MFWITAYVFFRYAARYATVKITPTGHLCKFIHTPLRQAPLSVRLLGEGVKRPDVVPAESRTGAGTNIRLQRLFGNTGISMVIPAAVITHLGMPVRSSPPPPSFLMPDECPPLRHSHQNEKRAAAKR